MCSMHRCGVVRISSSVHEIRDLRGQWGYKQWAGRQWDTFSSSSGTEDFAAGEVLLTGTNTQIQALEVTTQKVDRGQLCLH